jgi:VanZ family protein
MQTDMRSAEWTRWTPPIFWMAVIFCFSHRPNIETGLSCDFSLKKMAHFVEYAILAFSLYRALRLQGLPFQTRIAQKAWALATLYAVSDEFHQWFIPSRTAHPRDVVIDSLGAGCLLLGLWFSNRRAHSLNPPE